MLNTFRKHIKKEFPELLTANCLLAISGGLDSVVLAHLLRTTGVHIAFAHCNFNLRGKESDRDEQFVQQLAITTNATFHSTHFKTKKVALERGVSTQMAARDLRYEWFDDLKVTHNYDLLLTGHHLDDQLETFLINLSRGSGVDGLTGIPAQNGWIRRPLLPFSREQINIYAQENNLEWREDSSNASNAYTRNELRNKVIPLLKDALPDLEGNLQQTFKHLKDSRKLVNDAVFRFRESEIITDHGRMYIPIKSLNLHAAPAGYLYELLKEYKPHMPDVMALLKAQTGATVYAGSKQILRDRAHLIIDEIKETKEVKMVEINELNTPINYCGHSITIKKLNTMQPLQFVKENNAINSIFLDADALKEPLFIRSWKRGDKIAPYGMHGTKLVSDLIIDAKIPLIDKEKVVVLISDKKILGVLGVRASNHYAITRNTTTLLEIKYTP